MIALVAAISAALVGMLSDAGLPALTDGAILVGRQHVLEQSAPPRVVFVPMRSTFAPREVTSPSQATGNPHDDQRAAWLTRSLLTDVQHFEVNVWGAASPPDPNGDFDATETLYKLVLRAVHHVAFGAYDATDGEWIDQQADATQLVKLGHQYVLGISIRTPVPDDSLAYVPDGTTSNPSVLLDPGDGSNPEAP